MKRFIKLMLILAVVLICNYAGVWYYGCMRLEKKLARQEFQIAVGPQSELTMDFKFDRGASSFVGALQGEVGIEFELRSMSSNSSVRLPGRSEAQRSSVTITPSGKPLLYRMSVPLWGNSLKVETSAPHELKYEMKVDDRSASMIHSGGPFAAVVTFRDPKLALQREQQIDTLIAEPKRIVDELAGMSLTGSGAFRFAEDGLEVVHGALSGGGIGWEIDSQDMLKVRSDVDFDFSYGNGFEKWLEIFHPAAANDLDPQAAAMVESMRQLQGQLITGGQFLMRGGIEVVLPANRLGLRDVPPAGDSGFPVPPFEVSFDRFRFRAPVAFSRPITLDGAIRFMRGEGKPLLVDLRENGEAVDVKAAVDVIVKQIITSGSFKDLGIDFNRVTAASLKSLNEVESQQGAFVMAHAAVRALSDAYFSRNIRNELKLEVKTSSGSANVFELLGAQARLKGLTMLGNGIGVELEGEREGPDTWRGQVTLHKLPQMIRELREPLTLIAVRSLIATFFDSDEGRTKDDAVSDQEKELLAFLFSEGLFDSLLASFDRIVQQVNQTPESSDKITLSLAGKQSEVTINGKKLEEVVQTLMPLLQSEGERLMAELEPKFEKLAQLKGQQPGELAAQAQQGAGSELDGEGSQGEGME